jgi:hypothetical protein
VFVTAFPFHPNLIFGSKGGKIVELHYTGWLIVLPVNIRQGLKLMIMTNNHAYYSTELITSVKKFYVTVPWVLHYKAFHCRN